MSDLISRQAAINVLEERLQANGYSNVALVSELNRSIGYLMQLPSAQPEHGRWIEDYYYDLTCSKCGIRPLFYYDTEDYDYYPSLSAFCPHCGAKMDGEEQ